MSRAQERPSDRLISELLLAGSPNKAFGDGQAGMLQTAQSVFELMVRAGVIGVSETPPVQLRKQEQMHAERDALAEYSPVILITYKDSWESSDDVIGLRLDPRHALTEDSAQYPALVVRHYEDGHLSDPSGTQFPYETKWYGFTQPNDAKAFVDAVGTQFVEPSYGGDDDFGYRTTHRVITNPWYVDGLLEGSFERFE